MVQALVVLALMGGAFGALLAVASNKLAVETDPRVDAVLEALPGANCGACGYPGCAGFAEAVVGGKAPTNACIPGKDGTAQAVAAILGQEPATGAVRKVAQLRCNGTTTNLLAKYEYNGIADCHLAVTQFCGTGHCLYGCIGLGSCVRVCPFGAIAMGDDRLPVVDAALCLGCELCAAQCPQKLLDMVAIDKQVYVRCSNRDRGRIARDECHVSCISCGLCLMACEHEAIQIVNVKNGSVPVIDYEKCTNCGACVEKCPRKCIHLDPPIDPDVTVCEKQEPPTAGGCANCQAAQSGGGCTG